MLNLKVQRGALLTVACTAALSLAACGQGDGQGQGKGNPLENLTGTLSGQNTTAKYNAYIEGLNKLIDDSWGVESQFDRYEKLNLPAKSAQNDINFPENIIQLEGAITKLKQGRANRGNAETKAADDAADKLIASAEALLAQWRDLSAYYETRAYRDDNLAKGKAAHDSLIQNYNTTLAAIRELDQALTIHQRKEAQQRIESYRKAGHNAEADLVEAMHLADLFTTAVIEDKSAEADSQLPALQAAIEKVRQSEEALPVSASNKIYIKLILGKLNRLVGSWRDYRANGKDYDRESVVDNYNSAIETMNRVELPA